MRQRLDFFIVGVQKGGTTAIWEYLRDHPGIQLPSVKEAHYFDDDNRVDWSRPQYQQLHRLFDWSEDNVVRGEATPIYIYWPESLRRIQRYNPSAKLIVALRHPTFRAFSHWRMERVRGNDYLSFEAAVSLEGRIRVEQSPAGVHRVYSYVERGFYALQVKKLLDLFPREQVHFLRTDSLWKKPGATLTLIERFLGVPVAIGESVLRRYVKPVALPSTSALSARARTLLDELYREDIKHTSELTGLNLSDWRKSDYTEPMSE